MSLDEDRRRRLREADPVRILADKLRTGEVTEKQLEVAASLEHYQATIEAVLGRQIQSRAIDWDAFRSREVLIRKACRLAPASNRDHLERTYEERTQGDVLRLYGPLSVALMYGAALIDLARPRDPRNVDLNTEPDYPLLDHAIEAAREWAEIVDTRRPSGRMRRGFSDMSVALQDEGNTFGGPLFIAGHYLMLVASGDENPFVATSWLCHHLLVLEGRRVNQEQQMHVLAQFVLGERRR